MKKVSALVAMLMLLVTLVHAQDKKPPMSPKVIAESPDKSIKVTYGQPSKRGRVIFGDNGLEKYGKVWRTGANEATQVEFKNDVMFGGQMVKAGTYTLYTIPNEKEWDVILNSTLGQWGAYDYDKIKGADVVKVKVPVKANTTPMEKLLITPTNNSITIGWDTMSIAVPVTKHG